MIELQHLPLFLILLLALLAAGIYSAFWLARTYILPVIKVRQRQRTWQRRLLQAELASWAIFIFFSAYRLLLAAPIVTVLLTVLLLLPVRYWWRDFIPGLLFRMDSDAENGDYLYHHGQQHTIVGIRSRSLKLRTEEGAYVILPYRLLKEVHIARAAQKTALTPHVFQIETKNAPELLDQLLAECPWIAPGQPPKVKPLEDGHYEITTFAPDEKIAEKQEAFLKEKVD